MGDVYKRQYQDRIAAVGRVVDGVAVGIRKPCSERATSSSRRELKCVIGRIGDVLKGENSTQAWVGASGQRVYVRNVQVRTCRLQILVGRAGWPDDRPAFQLERSGAVPWENFTG